MLTATAALRWRSAEASYRALPGAQAQFREEEVGTSTDVTKKALRGLGAAIYKGAEMSESR